MLSSDQTVAEVVVHDIRQAHVFKQFGIDFCCGGGITLHRAAEKYQVNLRDLLSALSSNTQREVPALPFNTWTNNLLCTYIEETHHRYVRESLQLLNTYAEKVYHVHGQNHAPLKTICEKLHQLGQELLSHMQKEEQILFPLLRSLEHQSQSPGMSPVSPMQVMEMEHEQAGDLMRQIRELTNQYQVPEWACNTFKAFYHKLEEFEDDLHQHVHLENNILFPNSRKILEAGKANKLQ